MYGIQAKRRYVVRVREEEGLNERLCVLHFGELRDMLAKVKHLVHKVLRSVHLFPDDIYGAPVRWCPLVLL